MHIAENWSRLSGTVEDWDPPLEPNAPGTLTLRVERVAEVPRPSGPAYANLLADAEGSVLRVQVPSAAAKRLKAKVGSRITVDVRRGRSPGQLFMKPEEIEE